MMKQNKLSRTMRTAMLLVVVAMLTACDKPILDETTGEAVKAGGLMLAQDAQPVLPTDPVDVALDYQLVPIGCPPLTPCI